MRLNKQFFIGVLVGFLPLFFSGFVASAATPVTFRWAAPDTAGNVVQATDYNVYLSIDGGAYTLVGSVGDIPMSGLVGPNPLGRGGTWTYSLQDGRRIRVQVSGKSALGVEGLKSLPSALVDSRAPGVCGAIEIRVGT